MSVHYLVKLSIRVLQVNSSWNCEPKNTNIFLSYLLQNEERSLSQYIDTSEEESLTATAKEGVIRVLSRRPGLGEGNSKYWGSR